MASYRHGDGVRPAPAADPIVACSEAEGLHLAALARLNRRQPVRPSPFGKLRRIAGQLIQIEPRSPVEGPEPSPNTWGLDDGLAPCVRHQPQEKVPS